MVFQPDKLTSQERPHDYGQGLRALIDFMKAGGNWEKIDPAIAEQHRATLRLLQRDQVRDYPDLSLGQAAEALIAQLKSATEAKQLRSVGDIITVPRLGSRQWEVIKIDHRSLSYFLADPRDQRSAETIVNAILSGQERDGEPTGYEVDWDDVHQLAA